MRFARKLKVLACFTLAAAAAQSAQATSVMYQFTTSYANVGEVPFPPLPPLTYSGPAGVDLFNALNGLTVTGSFLYDSDTPVTTTSDGPTIANLSSYPGAVSNLTGSIGTLGFTASTGEAYVADEGYGYTLPTPQHLDFFQFVHNVDSSTSVAGLPLVFARFIWIEGSTSPPGGPTDFLAGNSLLSTLPDTNARLALDFLGTNSAGEAEYSRVFFNVTSVTPVPTAVPEPATPALLLAGIALIAVARRQRKRTMAA